MRPLLPPLALALLACPAATQSHHPGSVVLLGELADPALVPELARPPHASVLLVVGVERSPVPLDARAWGGDARTEIVRLPPARRAEVDRDLLARVRAADLIALGPGSPKEWLDALLDRERSSALLRAIHETWSGGALLVGRGDPVAVLSAAFAVSGPTELDWDVRNPRDDGGSRAAQGLGYQPWAMIDTQARSEGSLGRLVRSVCREKIELALWLPATGSVVVDLTASRLRVHGEGEVILLDARGARRNRGSVQGARLTVLPPGALWDAGERRVALTGQTAAAGVAEVRVRVDDVLEARGLGARLSAPGGPKPGRWILEDGRRRLELCTDESSRWGRLEGGQAARCWVEGLACDLRADGL